MKTTYAKVKNSIMIPGDHHASGRIAKHAFAIVMILVLVAGFGGTTQFSYAANPGAGLTIKTDNIADTRARGMTINLFDYGNATLDTKDDWNNSFERWWNRAASSYNTGINAGKSRDDLLFLHHGTSRGQNTGQYTAPNALHINNYSGGTWPALGSVIHGIVKPQLGSDGYPVLTTNNSSLAYLFNATPNGDTKKVYQDVGGLFIQDGEKLRYSSDENYAFYGDGRNPGSNTKPYSDGGRDFTLYTSTYDIDRNPENGRIGFFPFNLPDNDIRVSKDTTEVQGNTYYNHHFGMTLDVPFLMPKDGKVTKQDGTKTDMVFEFSGDDDLWVFVDDVLILDLGGIHNPAQGEINFATGEVKIPGGYQTVGQTNDNVRYDTVTIAQLMAAQGVTWDDSTYSEHTLKAFYLERGGMYSNCTIMMNLLATRNVAAAKRVKDSSGNILNDNQLQQRGLKDKTYKCRLWFRKDGADMKNTVDKNDYYIYDGTEGTGETAYKHKFGGAKICDAAGNKLRDAVFASDGTVELKAGERLVVEDAPDDQSFFAEEVDLDRYVYSTPDINGAAATKSTEASHTLYYGTAGRTINYNDTKSPMWIENILADTTSLKLRKLDAQAGTTKTLEGATFDLYKLVDDGEEGTVLFSSGYYANKKFAIYKSGLSTGSDGTFEVGGITEGTYALVETEAPEGYFLPEEPFAFQMSFNKSNRKWTVSTDHNTESNAGRIGWNNTNKTLDVKNAQLYELPETDGFGTFCFTLPGMLIIALSVALYQRSRKRRDA
ncbi:MAG: hypothetical protein MJ128_00385 [Mogibacterium sp.]|nr:hypothetical protein [Mogibacterium sp.]